MHSRAAANRRFVESEKIHLARAFREDRAREDREPAMNTGGVDCSRRHKGVVLSPASNECDRGGDNYKTRNRALVNSCDRRVFAPACSTDRRPTDGRTDGRKCARINCRTEM